MDTHTQFEQHGTSDEMHQQIADLLDKLVTQTSAVHSVLAIERLDHSVRWTGTTGLAHSDGTPMRIDTPYWIASVTKLYIAAAIFKLIEQGLITLRTSIYELLPVSKINGLHRLNSVDYTHMITIQHLLGHSSGLPDYLEESPGAEMALMDSAVHQDRAWTFDDAVDIVRDRLAPHFPPQELDARRQKIRYSDTNYQLLIQVLETVHGQPLHRVFASDFYEPLGLTETRHPENIESDRKPASTWFGDTEFVRPRAMRSFRDLVSTADEQVRFMRALVSGEVFERTDTDYRMMGNWNSFPISLDPAPKSPVWPIQYGLGAMRIELPRLFTPIRRVPAVMGHTGIPGSWLFYCPDLEVVMTGTVDQTEAAAVPFRFVPRLIRTLQDHLTGN